MADRKNGDHWPHPTALSQIEQSQPTYRIEQIIRITAVVPFTLGVTIGLLNQLLVIGFPSYFGCLKS